MCTAGTHKLKVRVLLLALRNSALSRKSAIAELCKEIDINPEDIVQFFKKHNTDLVIDGYICKQPDIGDAVTAEDGYFNLFAVLKHGDKKEFEELEQNGWVINPKNLKRYNLPIQDREITFIK